MHRRSGSEALLGHDIIEVFPGDLAAVSGCSLQHFLQLLNTHSLTEFLGYSFDIINVNGSAFVIVKQLEDLVDAVLNKS